MTFGQKLTKLRNLADLSQRTLASAIGTYQSQVAKWEMDKGGPGPKQLHALVLALRPHVPWLSADYLIDEEAEEPEDAKSIRNLTLDEQVVWTLIRDIRVIEARRRILGVGTPPSLPEEPAWEPSSGTLKPIRIMNRRADGSISAMQHSPGSGPEPDLD